MAASREDVARAFEDNKLAQVLYHEWEAQTYDGKSSISFDERCTIEGRVADAERIPYEDNTFDVVVGHAVIHHIPDVEAAFAEMLRVLKPGGRFVIAGEPTRIGDWYARRLGRLTWHTTKAVTTLPPLRVTWAKDTEALDEAAVKPGALGWAWAKFAYGSWRRSSALDRVLARAVPARFFYDVGITGVKPA